MNFFQALSLAVKDGKKIRQTEWTPDVYATADERGFITLSHGCEANSGYFKFAQANWELYTRFARFKDVKVGEKFNFHSYPELSPIMRIDLFNTFNAITKEGKGITIHHDMCVEIIDG